MQSWELFKEDESECCLPVLLEVQALERGGFAAVLSLHGDTESPQGMSSGARG